MYVLAAGRVAGYPENVRRVVIARTVGLVSDFVACKNVLIIIAPPFFGQVTAAVSRSGYFSEFRPRQKRNRTVRGAFGKESFSILNCKRFFGTKRTIALYAQPVRI